MSRLRVIAPGKLMLAGEYSVLLPGGLAWALAVPLGIDLEATPCARWELVRDDMDASWVEGGAPVPEALRFAHAALLTARAQLDVPPQRLAMRPCAGVETGSKKPGVGGSAAICAAVCAALHALEAGSLDGRRAAIFEMAFEAHHKAQGGRGSGYDVATVVYGELTRFCSSGVDAPASARSLPWPAGLHAIAGSTQESANTRTLLEQLEARRREDERQVQEALAELAAPVARLDGLFEAEPFDWLFPTLRACQKALQRFDERLSLGVITPAIARLLALAKGEGVTAKVSGAGGGDSLIALSGDRQKLDALAEAWRGAGAEVFSLRPAPGVQLVAP